MNSSNFFSKEFMEGLIFLEVATIVVVFKFVNSLIQHCSSKRALILECFDKGSYSVVVFIFLIDISFHFEFGYHIFRDFFVLMTLFDIYQIE